MSEKIEPAIAVTSGKQAESFDAIIIGTGQAAPALANRLTASGMRVAVIERGAVGGTCVNTGCTPTKTMVASAYAARMAARAAEYGVVLHQPPTIDMKAIRARVDAVVQADRTGLENWMIGMPGCTLIRGHARFESADEISIHDRRIKANKIFINVGGRAFIPDIAGLENISYLTNTDMVALDAIPSHLIIIGGSYIGLEFAQMFRRFGSSVTVIERGSRLIAREDEEISAQIKDILSNEDISIVLDADELQLQKHAAGVAVNIKCKNDSHEISGSHLLIAVGRRPNTDDLGLDKAGIATDAMGYISVDEQLRTNVKGVWALGDCNGRGAFTHTAYNDFEIVAENLLDGGTRCVSDRIPAYALYIDPPLGRVGMTAAQAKKAGRKIREGIRPMTRVARAIEKGETQGSMRVVVDAETDEILGAAILGPGGDEAIHTILATMAAKAPYTQLAHTMAIHPTLSELIPTVLGELSNPL
jgi:pyruvate/2-oxoglutarate dehydrogenase complex dihydrolipoamide dehydrogenase (E3) component